MLGLILQPKVKVASSYNNLNDTLYKLFFKTLIKSLEVQKCGFLRPVHTER